MRDIKEIVASVDATMSKFRRGLLSLETVEEIFNDEWNRNLHTLMREIRGGINNG